MKRAVLVATDTVFGTVTNVILFQIFLSLMIVGKRSPGQINFAFDETQRILRDVNYQTIKATVYSLIKAGLLARPMRYSRTELQITLLGKKRIGELVPTYQTNRPWDGYMYLISYDIPTSSNRYRDLLREYLRRLSCARLQDSLWITPYSPRKILYEFVRDRGIPGTILVSKLGKDGSIGEERLQELLVRAYKLEALSERYKEFLDAYDGVKYVDSVLSLSFKYFSILKDDPQLPFELLPKNFPGEKAHKVYTGITLSASKVV